MPCVLPNRARGALAGPSRDFQQPVTQRHHSTTTQCSLADCSS